MYHIRSPVSMHAQPQRAESVLQACQNATGLRCEPAPGLFSMLLLGCRGNWLAGMQTLDTLDTACHCWLQIKLLGHTTNCQPVNQPKALATALSLMLPGAICCCIHTRNCYRSAKEVFPGAGCAFSTDCCCLLLRRAMPDPLLRHCLAQLWLIS